MKSATKEASCHFVVLTALCKNTFVVSNVRHSVVNPHTKSSHPVYILYLVVAKPWLLPVLFQQVYIYKAKRVEVHVKFSRTQLLTSPSLQAYASAAEVGLWLYLKTFS